VVQTSKHALVPLAGAATPCHCLDLYSGQTSALFSPLHLSLPLQFSQVAFPEVFPQVLHDGPIISRSAPYFQYQRAPRCTAPALAPVHSQAALGAHEHSGKRVRQGETLGAPEDARIGAGPFH
jgi:hypothetical protein